MSNPYEQFLKPEPMPDLAAAPAVPTVAPGAVAIESDPGLDALKQQTADWYTSQVAWDRTIATLQSVVREADDRPPSELPAPRKNPYLQYLSPDEPQPFGFGAVQRGLGQAGELIGQGFEQDVTAAAKADRESNFIPSEDEDAFSVIFNGLGTAGKAILQEPLKSWGKRQQETAGSKPIGSVWDIRNPWDALSWVTSTTGEAIGTSIPIIAGGIAASGGGVYVTARAMGIGQARQEFLNEQAELRAKAEQAARMGNTALRDQINKAADGLSPDNHNEIVQTAGSVIAALEAIVPGMLVLKGVPESVLYDLKREMRRTAIAHVASRVATGAVIEGITEVTQAATAIIGVVNAKGAQGAAEYLKALNDARWRLIEEGLAGAAGGAGLGGIGATRNVAVAYRDRLKPSAKTQDEPPTPSDQPVIPSAGGVELPPGMAAPAAQATPETAQPQAPAQVTAPDPAAEVEQAVDLWRQAQASQAVAEDVAPMADTAEALATPQADALTEAIENLPPEQQQAVAPALAAAEQASPGITEQITDAVQQTQAAPQVPAELQAELERLGIAQARTEDEVRQLVVERQRAVAMAERERATAEAAQREQRMAPVRQYLAQGGRLDRARYRDIGRAAGVQESQVPALLAEAEQMGLVRKDQRGRYRRQLQTPTAGSAREAIEQVARELAPILPRGTVVRSFADLASLPERTRGALRQDGDRVVSAASGGVVDAFEDAGTIYVAEYALNPDGRLTHEALHALVTSGLVSPQEIATLADRARKTGAFTKKAEAAYERDYKARFPDDWKRRVDEEAAAALVEARVNGADHGRSVNAITDRIIEFFARLRNALRGRGFRSSEDVMTAFFSGEMARRQAVQSWMRENDVTALAVRDGQVMAAMGDAEGREYPVRAAMNISGDIFDGPNHDAAITKAIAEYERTGNERRLDEIAMAETMVFGFITNSGRFVTRQEAMNLAVAVAPEGSRVARAAAGPWASMGFDSNMLDEFLASIRSQPMFALSDSDTGAAMRRAVDDLGFYSKLDEVLGAFKPKDRVTAATLQQRGVKLAEIEARGLKDALADGKSVAVSDLMETAQANRVEVREVGYGADTPAQFEAKSQASIQRLMAAGVSESRAKEMIESVYDAGRGMADDALFDRLATGAMVSDNLVSRPGVYSQITEALAQFNEADADTRWSSYSLDPNNPSYRETVLHLPSAEVSTREVERMRTLRKKRDMVRLIEREQKELADIEARLAIQEKEFRSGHFSEPNIIGHMMTSMVKHEGRPVYLIDQIQSDWGQKLRDGGVRDEAKIADLTARINALDDLALKARRKALAVLPDNLRQNVDRAGPSISLSRIDAEYGAILSPEARTTLLDAMEAENEAKSGIRLLDAERATAEESVVGHPLVNTTDQWVNTTLRRALRQAVEADAAYIAIPHGDTVLSYNPGDTDGMRGFYDGIVPKNLRNILSKLDKDSPAPQRVDTLETPTKGRAGKGFTLFPLTDTVKAKVRSEGQAMFALSDDRPVTPGLDMSPEARKQRAEAMGFDTGRVWYHGTTTTFDAFRTGERGAVFLADQPYVTEHFANPYKDDGPAQVLPVYIKAKRVFDPANDWDNPSLRSWVESNIRRYDIESIVSPGKDHTTTVDEVLTDLRNSAFGKDMFEPVEHPVIQEWIKQNGYDGFITKDASWMAREAKTPARIIGLFDPRNIRSINAAFDPANADSPNLMFALGDEPRTPPSLQSIVSDLARDLGLTIRQGMRTAGARAARRAGLDAVYDPTTGIVRTRSVADLKAIARAAGQSISHRFDLDALLAENAADLTLPEASLQQPAAFAADGFSGLTLDAPTMARARDTALALVRASARNASGQDAGDANATAERAMHDLARRLGRPTAIAVIKDTLGAQKALSTADQAGLLILAESPGIATPRDITARLDGMPYLPQAVRVHILQGRSPQEMKARARQVVVETLDPAELRRTLAAFDAAAASPAFRAQDVVQLADSLRIDATAINDLMAQQGANAVPEIRARVQRLIADAEAAAMRPPVVPSLYEAATLPDAEAAARIEARLIARFTPDGKPDPGPAQIAPDAETLNDAFADWFRDYLLSPTKAEAQAPYLYDQVEALIDANDPVLLAKLESTQQAIQAYIQSNPADIVEGGIRDGLKPGFWDRFGDDMENYGLRGALSIRASRLYTVVIDKNNPFAVGVSEALRIYQRNRGVKLDIQASENAYKLMRLAPHSHAWAARDMEEGVRNRQTGDHEGPGLIEALTTALGKDRATARDVGPGSRYRKFGSYLVARYAAIEWGRFRDGQKERPPTAQPPGTNNPDEVIAFYENLARQLEQIYPSFIPAAEAIYEYEANLLKLQRDAGLITPETYDTLITDTSYVPFYRHFDEQADLSSRALSVGPGGILKKKRGSDRDIIDPIAGIAQKTFETRAMIAQNDVKRQLLRLAELAGPGGGVIAERIDPNQLKGTELDIEVILRNAAREVDADPRDISQMVDMMQQVLGNDAIATYYTQRHIQPGKRPIVFYFEGGKAQAMQLGDGENGHKLAAQMHDVLNTFGKEHLDAMMELAALPAHITRIGVTTHPEFAAANVVRDGPMAFQYDPRAVPFVTQAMGLIDIARGAPHVRKFLASGGMMGGEATSYADKLRTERDISALIERGYRFKNLASLANLGDYLRELTEARNFKDRAVGGLVGAIAGAAVGGPVGAVAGATAGMVAGGKAIVKIGEITETATRVRLFKHAYDRAIDAGLDEVAATQEAAFWAHDYTDYSRRGHRMDGAAKLIPFLNANLQGNDVYLRRLLGKGDQGYNPGFLYPLYRLGMLDISKLSPRERQELGLSAWSWAMTVLGLGSITAAFALAWDDDDRLKDIDDRVKASHWLVPVDGSTVLRIPKPFQTVWFAQLIERYITEGKQGDSRWKEHYLEDLWSTWKPPLIPSVAEIGATLTGYDLNSGREVVPHWMRMGDKGRDNQFDAYTSDFAKWAGPKLNVAPLYVDHVITKFGATWGRTALSLNVPGTPWYNPQRPTKGPEEEFIARRFLWKVGRGSEAGQALREMMGAEDPLPKIWGALAQPVVRYAARATDVRTLLEKPIPDHAGAVTLLEQMTLKERGYAILESYFRGRNEAKYRMLHPMNRAEKIARETMQLEKMLIGGELLTGRKGKDQKQVPLPPSEKAAARDILTQLRMMETHNAMVLTNEPGWEGRQMFNTYHTLQELKAASPKTHSELLRRYETAGVVSDAGIRRVWPEVKGRLEDPRWLDRVRKNQLSGASGMFASAWVKANAARPATIVEPPPPPVRPAPLPGMMRLGGPMPAPRPAPQPAPPPVTPPAAPAAEAKPAPASVKIARNADGRAETVTRGDKTFRIERDAQGRVSGLTEIMTSN